jgi:hypothetical protein
MSLRHIDLRLIEYNLYQVTAFSCSDLLVGASPSNKAMLCSGASALVGHTRSDFYETKDVIISIGGRDKAN